MPMSFLIVVNDNGSFETVPETDLPLEIREVVSVALNDVLDLRSAALDALDDYEEEGLLDDLHKALDEYEGTPA